MGFYIAFSLLCAVLALIYLNRGKGSSRLYPSIAAVLVFLLFMYLLSQTEGYAFDAAMTSCTAGIIAGLVVYWAALLIQKLWSAGNIARAAAMLACICTFYLSVPTLLLGTAVYHLFRTGFAAADEAAAEQEAERLREREEKLLQRDEKEAAKRAREDELLQNVHSDDELCMLFAQMYQRMGYAPTVERVGTDGPLRMFLNRDGNTFSFVAIARRELLGRESVEWAAGFRGDAQRAGLVTAGTFTAKAVRLAKRRKVALVDRPNLPLFERAAQRAEQEKAENPPDSIG